MRNGWKISGQWTASVAVLFGVAACEPAAEAPPPELEARVETYTVAPDLEPPAEAVHRARGAADALTTELQSRLMAELQAGGPVQGVAVCSEIAPALAAQHSGDGVFVRRVSQRVRNPASRPDAFEDARLERLADLHARGELPPELTEVVRVDGRAEMRYMRPILVAQPCMQCHGPRDQMAPEVVRMIDERYPADEATGYQVGDLRGAVSVRVALEDEPEEE